VNDTDGTRHGRPVPYDDPDMPNNTMNGTTTKPQKYCICQNTDSHLCCQKRCANVAGGAVSDRAGRGKFFKSWESDCSFFDGCHPWFCCGTVQSVNTTMSHWESTWGRGTNYILNVPPSTDGEIEPALVAASAAFHTERERRYGDGKELGKATGTVGEGETLVLKLASASKVDRVLFRDANSGGPGGPPSPLGLAIA
jgi:hypothetical protein